MNYEPRTIGEERLALPGEGRDRSRRRLIIGIVVVVIAVLALGYMIFGGRGGAADGQNAAGVTAQVPTITVSTPGRRSVQHELAATGTLGARREMPVGVAGEGGEVRSVLVEPGDWVKAGQVLATIDRSVQTQTAASLAAQIKVAQADADLAQSNLDRSKQLVGRGFVSKADIDEKTATRDSAAARVRVAQAQLGEAKARTGQLDIRAPAAGLVLTRSVEPGQIVSSGSGTLFRMAKGGEMEMLARLSESDLGSISVGANAVVTPVGQSDSFKGQVWQISPIIDPQTRQGIARIALSYNPALRPGGFATATVGGRSQTAAVLPDSAIQSDGKGNYVYIVDDKNQVVRRDVTVGEVTDAGVSVTGGLNGSEKIVLSAGAFLTAGQKVKPEMQKGG